MASSLSVRRLFYSFLLVYFLIHNAGCTPITVKVTADKNTQVTKGDAKPQSDGAQTVIRPTNIFKTDGDAMINQMSTKPIERDLRPFEWLYQHLGDYLMCAYGRHAGCEQKLARAMSLDQPKPQSSPENHQNYHQGMSPTSKPGSMPFGPLVVDHPGPQMQQDMQPFPPMQPNNGPGYMGQQPYFGHLGGPLPMMEPPTMIMSPYGPMTGVPGPYPNGPKPLMMMNPMVSKDYMKMESAPMGQFTGAPIPNMPGYPMMGPSGPEQYH